MNQFPIRTISEITGVATTTLRAWERRYGLLKPERTSSGHRVYSQDDIETIKNVVRLLKKKHTISEAVRILKNPEQDSRYELLSEGHWLVYQQKMLGAIESYNEALLDSHYNDALSLYPVDLVTENLILPILQSLGDRWKERSAGIAEEHFFSSFLRNKLGARLHHEARRSKGKTILVACIPGEHHELGLLLFCLSVLGRGYQILYLGPDMPSDQLAIATERTAVEAILLSGSRAKDWDLSVESMIRKTTDSSSVKVFFGGEYAVLHQKKIEKAGATSLGSEHGEALNLLEKTLPPFSTRR